MNSTTDPAGPPPGQHPPGSLPMDPAVLRLLDDLPVSVTYTALDGRVLYHNRHTRALLGYQPEDLVRLRAQQVYANPAEREELLRQLSQKGEHTFECQLRRQDGQTIWVYSQTRITSLDNQACVVSIFEDITERKRRDRELRLSLSLQRVRNQILQMQQAADWEQVIRVIHRELSALVDFAFASIQFIDHQAGTFSSYTTAFAPEEWPLQGREHHPLPPSLRQVVQTGQTLYRQTRAEVETCQDEVGEDARSVVDVPFPGGTLAMNSTRENAFSEEDIRGLEAFAQVVHEGYQRLQDLEQLARTRRQMETELRASEAKYRNLFAEMGHGFSLNALVFDDAGNPVDYVTLEVNQAFEQILGVSRAAVVGKPASRFLPPEELRRWVALFGRVVLENQPQHYDQESPSNQKNFHGYAYALDRTRFAVLFEDTTERKKAADALRESEELHRLVVDNSLDGILITTPDGRIQAANPAACRMLQRSEEELCRLGRDALVAPSDPRLSALLAERARTGRAAGELTMLRGDGTALPVEISSALFLDRHGAKKTSMILRDITERRKTEYETRISLSLQHLRNQILLLERAEDWLTVAEVFSAELRRHVPCHRSSIQLVDPQRGTYISYQSDDHLVTVSPPSPLPAGLQETLASGQARYRRTRSEMSAAGDRVAAEVACIVDVPFLGGTVAMNSVHEQAFTEADIALLEHFAQVLSEGYKRLEDLTRLAEVELQLARAQKMEAVGQLTAGVAHNFNNLVQAIVANLSLAAMKGPPQIQVYLEEADAAAMRGADLVRQLMLFSRVETREAARKTVDLGDVIQSTTSLARKTIDLQIELRVEVAPDLPRVQVDVAQIEQVLMNLVLNARDALTEAGQTQPSIQISAGPVRRARPGESGTGDYLRLAVRDNGTGMDAQTRERVFEPFFTTKEVGKGTGLGLATAYGILQRHQGWIECESQLGKGTCFALYLPVASAAAAPAPPLPPKLPTGTETLLLIDDEGMVRRGTRELLTSLGYRVLEAEDGQQGLEQAARHRGQLDLVLLDLSMPGIPGHEVLHQLQATQPELRVVLFTGYAPEQNQLPAGVPVVEKPFSLHNLAQAVRRILDN